MRKLLEILYGSTAFFAALGMVGVLAMVMLSILSRQLGFNVSGTDAYAGYCMAASGFLALAHTLKRNEHIRVTLVLGRLSGRAKQGMERWALSVAVLLSALFCFYSARLVWMSYEYHDVSTSNDATPLWIPQFAMLVGTAVLFIAFVDEWVLEWRGLRQAQEPQEALRNE